jgi:hypothetical protein
MINDILSNQLIIGRESAINRVLDSSTYPGKKLVPSSLDKKIVKKCNNLYLGLVMPSSG